MWRCKLLVRIRTLVRMYSNISTGLHMDSDVDGLRLVVVATFRVVGSMCCEYVAAEQ